MLWTFLLVAHAEEEPASPAPSSGVVVSVYDGDTFTLDDDNRVRLMWVNTPEKRPPEAYAEESTALAERMVIRKEIELFYGNAERDGYGRLLGAVKVEGEWVAEALLREGYAHLFLFPPMADFVPYERLLAVEAEARDAKIGIWSEERYSGALHITSFHANARGNDTENLNKEYLRLCNVSGEPLQLADYRIADLSGSSWRFPEVVVPAGHTIKVMSGFGEHQLDPNAPIEVYLRSEWPIWNNDHDRATIYDLYGKVVDARTHKVKGYDKPPQQ